MPEDLRSKLSPEVAAFWDPCLPMALNYARLVTGDMEMGNEYLSGGKTKRDEIQLHQNASTSSTNGKVKENRHRDPVQDVATSMYDLDPNLAPLRALQVQVINLFQRGPNVASRLWNKIFMAILNNSEPIPASADILYIARWTSCKLAATLVLVLAASKESMFEALKFLSRSLGGLPTLPLIQNTPSASFKDAFNAAKASAMGHTKRTTVIAACLFDVHMFELAGKGISELYSSFAHTFVTGVGPEGVIIWQSWGEHGYCFDEYIDRGGARMRTWKEEDEFMGSFEHLEKLKVRNALNSRNVC